MIYLMAFIAGIIEVFVSVLDFKVTQKNRVIFSTITTILAGLIWYTVIRIIIPNITNIYLAVVHSLGCGLGCFTGLKIEAKLDEFFYIKKSRRKKLGKTMRKLFK
jgi:uncharacterized protein YebE (UPF0316 family)